MSCRWSRLEALRTLARPSTCWGEIPLPEFLGPHGVPILFEYRDDLLEGPGLERGWLVGVERRPVSGHSLSAAIIDLGICEDKQHAVQVVGLPQSEHEQMIEPQLL